MHARKLSYLHVLISFILLVICIDVVLAQDLKQAPFAGRKLNNDGTFEGYIPIQADLPEMKYTGIPDDLALDLPTRFDWREQGMVTSVKNQGNCGSCYAFAFLSCFESTIKIKQGETCDLSENNAKECNWYGTSCDGGADWVMASFLNKYGTVLEEDDPYVANNVSCISSAPKHKTLLDWSIISEEVIPSASILKYYVLNNGPLVSYFYIGDSNYPGWNHEFNDYDGSYTLYFSSSYSVDPNHLVLIVGWDDTLSHDGGQGAWIAKNSWGDNWGGPCGYGSESGYFTIAYNSANIGKYASYIGDFQNYDDNGGTYFLDEGGFTTSWGFEGQLSAWGMVKYTISEDSYLETISFWTNDENTAINIGVYDTFNGSVLSDLLANKSGLIYEHPGLHTARLDSAIQISANDNIFVAVKYSNTSIYYPVTADDYGPTEAYDSYISLSGSAGTWIDLGGDYQSDIAIRIHCTNSAFYLSAPNGDEVLGSGTNREITWSSMGDIDNVKLEYSSNDGSNWNLIESSVPNNGSYTWTVPYAISENCLVRVSDAEDGVPCDISDTPFTIYCPVWPGDLDANGLVDAEDILPLAEYWYRTGPERASETYDWSSQSSTPWENILITYADADGSGRVDVADFFPICLNWNKTHDTPIALALQKHDYDIEKNRDVLMRIYGQVSDADSGAELEIKEYLSRILELPLPLSFKLEEAYPNPFNNTTVIGYTLSEASQVNLSIYNIRGQVVATLVDGYVQPGEYQVKWNGLNSDGDEVASGVYFVKLQSETNSSIKTMSLIK